MRDGSRGSSPRKYAGHAWEQFLLCRPRGRLRAARGVCAFPPASSFRVGRVTPSAGRAQKKGAHPLGWAPFGSEPLERDVVAGRAGCGDRLELLALARLRLAAEELDRFGHDRDVLATTVVGIPLAEIEATLDSHGPAFGEVLRATLALSAPDGDVEVVGLVDPLFAAVLAASIDSDPEVADLGPAIGGFQVGVAGEVAGDDD